MNKRKGSGQDALFKSDTEDCRETEAGEGEKSQCCIRKREEGACKV